MLLALDFDFGFWVCFWLAVGSRCIFFYEQQEGKRGRQEDREHWRRFLHVFLGT